MSSRQALGLWLIAVLCLLANLGVPAPTSAEDWPQWRGPNRDGISTEKNLLKEWPADGAPKVVWQVDSVGVGYSSVVVKDGRVITQGDLNGVEHVIALNADDGNAIIRGSNIESRAPPSGGVSIRRLRVGLLHLQSRNSLVGLYLNFGHT